MRNRVTIYMMLCIVLLVTMSCHQVECESTGEGTCLTLSVRTSLAVSRGVEDLNDDGTVSDLESFVDGRKMYRLGVFLVENGTTVASTVLEDGDERFSANNTAAMVKFENLDYSKTYQLYAIANYGNNGSIQGNVSDITADNIIASHRVTASTGNMCDAQKPCPLALKKELKLNPGVNNISGQLTRTNARLRISVRNQSDTKDLTISKLEFPTKFTQPSVEIFDGGGTASVCPQATASSAITPFAQGMVIPRINDSASANEKTIYDAYVLESTDGEYEYTIGLQYEGVGGASGYKVEGDAFSVKESIEDGSLYVMRFTYPSTYYLYADGDVVRANDDYEIDGKIDPRYVWRFHKVAGMADTYTIESLGPSGGFMKASTFAYYSNLQMTDTPAATDYFIISNTTNSYYGDNMQAKAPTGYCIYVNGAYVLGSSSSWYCNFRLLKVKEQSVTGSITHEETIPIKVLDGTGHNLPIETINRNDFIDILVNVSYNDKTGEVLFDVANWNQVSGDVTFD